MRLQSPDQWRAKRPVLWPFHQEKSEDSLRFESLYGLSLHTRSVPSYACIRPIHRIAQGENIKVAEWRSHGFLFSAIVMYVHQEFVYSTEYMRMRSRIWNLA